VEANGRLSSIGKRAEWREQLWKKEWSQWPGLNRRPTVYELSVRQGRVHCLAVKLNQSLQNWAGLQGVGKKPRTQKYHREIIALILDRWPELVDVDANDISDQQVVDFVLQVAHFSASRYNAILCALRATVPAAKKIKRRRVVLKDRPLLSQLEFSRLLEELDRRPQSHAGLVVRFLAHTGLRINEARQLKWSDVYENFILCPGSISKNGRPRMIPFVNGIAGVLDRLRPITTRSGLVLPQGNVKRALNRACELASVSHLSHHDFRHLFATRCVQSGVDIPTVARWLGHQDGGALLGKTYFHLADEHSRKMAAKVEI
jgi:integrase